MDVNNVLTAAAVAPQEAPSAVAVTCTRELEQVMDIMFDFIFFILLNYSITIHFIAMI